MTIAIDVQATSLYRFYGANDVLLYVGITNCLPRRFMRHEDEKPWWEQVARVTVEQHADREIALAAEKAAIETERPRFNIKHNGHRTSRPRPAKAANKSRWRFTARRYGYTRTAELWLYPELACSPMVDDYYDYDGEEQFDEYVAYIRRRYPQYWEHDAVPIYWSVRSDDDGVHETAPFQMREVLYEDFLTHFTWPTDSETGERLDWYQLPVVNYRFPEFAEALAWTPSPLQPSCPLRSIVRSRGGFWRPRSRRSA